jgi:hypothetical protein
MADSTPNEKLVGSGDGASIVAAQKRAEGTYKERAHWGTLTASSAQKSTVTPFRVTSGGR